MFGWVGVCVLCDDVSECVLGSEVGLGGLGGNASAVENYFGYKTFKKFVRWTILNLIL